ncbi:MAG TPA: glycerate kinase [Acidimicrobiales bacterium]|nr:glycerate kinase [Acidimicrobiales bacterium]
MGRLVAAPDKFRGTATAAQVAAAIAHAADRAGWSCDQAPVADGGEGTLEALCGTAGGAGGEPAADGAAAPAGGGGGRSAGGSIRHTTVTGPLGQPVTAEWRMLAGGTAVVETARASGITLVGGPEGNDPLRASTRGTGELIAAALDAGATRVIVGVGGSATTDGGLAALTALNPRRRLKGAVEVLVACDVTTHFVDAAEVFAPQKGATPAQVALLRRRLERLAEVYVRDYGVDVRDLPGSGAAGGLAGGLAAACAVLVPGFELVAEALDLAERIAGADLVVTGEGHLDAESFAGKAVGGVVDLATDAGVTVLVVAGRVEDDEIPSTLPGGVTIVSLVERFGLDEAMWDPIGCVDAVVSAELARLPAPGGA